ncbi:MAG: SPOR domain-containing protein [Candidatus Krumholzibacteriia bacterium]
MNPRHDRGADRTPESGPGDELAGRSVLPAGLDAAELDLRGGQGFWDEVQRITGETELGEHLDTAMGGHPAPRIWAVMAEPEGKAAAAAAGLALTRALAARGQAVILIDADDHQPDLTRWSGRFELEGWVDLVRYGASILTTSIPLEFPGKKSIFMGVGSFVPAQAGEDEVGDLLARLRRQADDLILVLPADENGAVWARRAPIRLLTWDRLARSREATAALVERLDELGAAPTSLVAFGPPEAAAATGAAAAPGAGGPPEGAEDTVATLPPGTPVPGTPVFDTPPGTSAVPATSPSGEPSPQIVDPAAREDRRIPSGAERGATPGPRSPEPEPEPATETVVAGVTPAGPLSTGGAWSSGGRPRPARRTSGLFWGLAAVLVLAIVAAAAYYLAAVRGPDPDTLPGDRFAGVTEDRPGQAREAEPLQDADRPLTESSRPLPVAGRSLPDREPPAGAADLEPGGEDLLVESAVDAGRRDLESGAADLREPVAEPLPPPVRSLGSDPAFAGPVGEDGWALWLYSHPDSAAAAAEVRELERRGLRAVYRPVQLAERGRWYRVYMGSFASREEAVAALPRVREALGQDWVQPARF